jgi:hypothetical protein
VYHARTVKAYRKFLAFAVAMVAAPAAHAQSAGEGSSAATGASGAAAYPSFANERHLVVRALAGAGLRINDAYNAGLLAPPYAFAQVSYLFVNAGPVRLGPALGGQVGLDVGHGPLQFTAQPGVLAVIRVAPIFAWTARLDVPILFTRGAARYSATAPNAPAEMVRAATPFTSPFSNASGAPFARPYTVGFGVEGAFGGALYLTAGVALTAEVTASMYFGDSFYTFPVIGGGLGLMVDYEMLP